MEEHDQFSRTRRLLGDAAMARLAAARVAVFGLGGVGAAARRRWPAAAWARWTFSTTTR